jgi:hypothetical protein
LETTQTLTNKNNDMKNIIKTLNNIDLAIIAIGITVVLPLTIILITSIAFNGAIFNF